MSRCPYGLFYKANGMQMETCFSLLWTAEWRRTSFLYTLL